jgi:polyketide synthase PksN
VLKRLADAVRDGDHIHAVIRGSGINQNGRSNGLIAPNARAQERLNRFVYDRFGIDPETIGVVEANGTGTILGDSIEYQAASRAFRAYTAKRQFCAIGSIATNLGHAASAAGVAGLLKLVLSLKHRQIPPSLHFEAANPAIDFSSGPFYVNTRLCDWDAGGRGPRRGAVSSFGIGGTNAHVVVEEAPAVAPPAVETPAHLIVLSARSAERLAQQVRNLLTLVHGAPDVSMNDLAYTLVVGRTPLAHRLACVVRTRAELIERLGCWLETGVAHDVMASSVEEGRPRERVALVKLGRHCVRECRATSDEAVWLEQLAVLADLYVQGCAVELQDLFPPGSRRMPLPTYPFADERYWIGGGNTPQPRARPQETEAEVDDVPPPRAEDRVSA